MYTSQGQLLFRLFQRILLVIFGQPESSNTTDDYEYYGRGANYGYDDD